MRAADLLGPGGPFARQSERFAPRAEQQAMANAVEAAIARGETLVVEAGTGTGKTFAYLVPVLACGRRAIVSTGTKALQDQLYQRDLPRVREALGVRLTAALLKGRANYLCLHRLQQAEHEGHFASREEVAQLARISAWAKRSATGDRAELAEVPEDSPLWPRVTSTVDNCLGVACPMYEQCFVVKARRAAQEADLVVVNHHLLFADLALRQEGFSELLPAAQVLVLDEAHQVPERAARFFSRSQSSRQLNELARDALAECAGLAGALALIEPLAQALLLAVKRLRLVLDPYPPRGPLAKLARDPKVQVAREHLLAMVIELEAGALAQAERSAGLDSVARRAATQRERLEELARAAEAEVVHWYELGAHGFAFHATPLDLSSPLRSLRKESGAAWILTSATLSVGGSFAHFSEQLGIDDAVELRLDSPFDYAQQALAYLPPNLPDPGNPDYGRCVIEILLPVLEASQGRAFLLFTSHRALREAAELLAGRLPWPLFVQGEAPRHRLLEAFRESGNGVLLGAASFWQGIDVVGSALSVVAIDKLPFEAPDDPVLAARLAALRAAGRSPFIEWQLPNAVIALKQGAGRLIRDVSDRGVLVLCDPRITSRGYGRTFLSSLPALPITRDPADVAALFAGTRGSV